MRFYVVSVLPELFGSFLQHGLVGKAIAAERLEISLITPRDFTTDRHRTVDDTPYGGGSGMVMMPGPVVDAMEAAEATELTRGGPRPTRILLSAQGERFSQRIARDLAEARGPLTLVCGRYEGVDERAVRRVDRELSLGDFVLMGGEVGAMAIIEAVGRLVPGVLGNPESILEESHSRGLLEHPHYTRPAVFRGEGVPDVLLSGNHAVIARWRLAESLRRTRERRPDLLDGRPLSDAERAALATLDREEKP